MMKTFGIVLLTCWLTIGFAQTGFEGTFTVDYKNEKGRASKLEVQVKDSLVRLKHTSGGNPKYDYYLLNTKTREFFTVSTADKKIVIKYDADKLLAFYEKHHLKEGFAINADLPFASTNKSKEENGMKLTRYTGENDIKKGTLWLTGSAFDFNQLIPVLRLLDSWNEAQAGEGLIVSAEVSSKVSNRQSAVAVSVKNGPVAKELFSLPKNYLQKDFAKLMEDEKDNKDMRMIIGMFAEF